MDVDVELRGAEHAVALLPDAQDVARRREVGVVQTRDLDEDVDDRLRRQAGNGGRADVLDPQRAGAERGGDPRALDREALRPRGVVRGDHDLPPLAAADQDPVEVRVIHAGSVEH